MVSAAGQMAESWVRPLVKRGARSILISNRSLDLRHPLGRTSSNATQRNAKAASVSMRGTFTLVTGVVTGVSAAAVAFHFR